jgi:hypothetical protein
MGNDSTHEIGVSLKVEVEVEAGLVKKTGSLELGYNYSTTESEETFSQLTNASESTCTASCRAIEGKRAYMYQWKKQAISATDTLSMSTCHYVCLYEQDAYPKCPPTDCKNQECTECIECKACE